MPKPTKAQLRRKARQVEQRIEQLRTKRVPIYSGPEDLTIPLDDDIVVEQRGR